MALRTLGTTSTTILGGFQVGVDEDASAANTALIQAIKSDLPMVNAVLQSGLPRNLINGAYTQKGTLIVPGRGVLIAKYGDFIGLDAVTGWPILLSADCAANGNWVHT
jgi:hypothetical protein